MTRDPAQMTFWEHLEELRGTLWRTVAAALACAALAFAFKDAVFAAVLAPRSSDFVTYRLLERAAAACGLPVSMESFAVRLISTGLASQFAIHVKLSVYAGFLLASPYVLYLLLRFITPALYERERRYSVRVAVGAYVMFACGAAVSYWLVFPFTLRFLGTYQVSAEVENLITLASYTDTLLALTFMLGLLFELPVACWLLGRAGLLTSRLMHRYRRHAIVVILVLAAVITPTSDVFTLLLTALPVWLLYELSALVVPRERRAKEPPAEEEA